MLLCSDSSFVSSQFSIIVHTNDLFASTYHTCPSLYSPTTVATLVLDWLLLFSALMCLPKAFVPIRMQQGKFKASELALDCSFGWYDMQTTGISRVGFLFGLLQRQLI